METLELPPPLEGAAEIAGERTGTISPRIQSRKIEARVINVEETSPGNTTTTTTTPADDDSPPSTANSPPPVKGSPRITTFEGKYPNPPTPPRTPSASALSEQLPLATPRANPAPVSEPLPRLSDLPPSVVPNRPYRTESCIQWGDVEEYLPNETETSSISRANSTSSEEIEEEEEEKDKATAKNARTNNEEGGRRYYPDVIMEEEEEDDDDEDDDDDDEEEEEEQGWGWFDEDNNNNGNKNTEELKSKKKSKSTSSRLEKANTFSSPRLRAANSAKVAASKQSESRNRVSNSLVRVISATKISELESSTSSINSGGSGSAGSSSTTSRGGAGGSSSAPGNQSLLLLGSNEWPEKRATQHHPQGPTLRKNSGAPAAWKRQSLNNTGKPTSKNFSRIPTSSNSSASSSLSSGSSSTTTATSSSSSSSIVKSRTITPASSVATGGAAWDAERPRDQSVLRFLAAMTKRMNLPLWMTTSAVFVKSFSVGCLIKLVPDLLVPHARASLLVAFQEVMRTGAFWGLSMSTLHAICRMTSFTPKRKKSDEDDDEEENDDDSDEDDSDDDSEDSEEEDGDPDGTDRRRLPFNPLAAALVLTPTLLLVPSHSNRVSLALFVLARAMECVVNGLLRRLPRTLKQQLPISKWLFALGNAQVVYCWKILENRDTLNPELVRFLDALGAVEGPRSLGGAFRGLVELASSDAYSAISLFAPNAFSRDVRAVALRALQSTAVLGSDLALSSFALAVLSRILKRAAPENAFWGGFSAGLLAIQLEPLEVRRVEMALFMLVQGFTSVFNLAARKNIIPSFIPGGEFAIYFASLAVVLAAASDDGDRLEEEEEAGGMTPEKSNRRRVRGVTGKSKKRGRGPSLPFTLVLGDAFKNVLHAAVVPSATLLSLVRVKIGGEKEAEDDEEEEEEEKR